MDVRFGGFGAFGLIELVWVAISMAVTIGIIVLIVLGIRWLLRNTDGGPRGGPGRPGEDLALAALRERFARGEIDATEFEERKRILGG
jgi:putative membrane protein